MYTSLEIGNKTATLSVNMLSIFIITQIRIKINPEICTDIRVG